MGIWESWEYPKYCKVCNKTTDHKQMNDGDETMEFCLEHEI